MKKLFLFAGIILFLSACESTVKADYDTIKAKKIILVGEDGKEYLLQVKNDSTGKATLDITENRN